MSANRGRDYVVGTGSLRAIVYDPAGNQIVEARHAFHNRFLEGGGVEQSAEEWRQGMAAALAECMAKADLRSADIRAIGVDGASDTVAPIGADGNHLASSLLWMDVRSAAEAAGLFRDIREAAEHMVKITAATEPAPGSFGPYRRYKEAYPALKAL